MKRTGRQKSESICSNQAIKGLEFIMSAKKPTALILAAILSCFLTFSIASAEPSQLNWIGNWKNEEKRSDLINEVKKEFEFLNPDVTVNLTFNVDLEAEGDNFKWKTAHTIVNMIQTGDIKWDVVFMDIIVYNLVAEILGDPKWGVKHLVDFSEVPGFLSTQKDFIVNDPFYKQQTGGIFVGPLIEGLFYCFWYNKEVAQKIGISVTTQGMKIGDLMTYAMKLSDYNKKNNTAIPLIWLGTWNRLDTLFEYLFKSQFDSRERVIEQTFNEEKKKAFLNTLLTFEELSRFQPALNPDYKSLHWGDWQNGFLENEGLFIVAGTFMFNHFMASGSDKYKKVEPAEYPIVKKANGLVGIYTPSFAVMKKSPNKKAAMDLMALWSEPKIAEKWVSYTRNPTGIKGNLDQPVIDALSNDVYKRFVRSMTLKYKNLPMRYFQEPSYVFGENCPVSAPEFRENLALILEGKQTAKQFFNYVLSRFNQ